MITKYNIFESIIYEKYKYKQFFNNKNDIKDWLDKYNIKKYTINNDLTVNVDGNVNLSGKQIFEIPFQFNIVNGSFNISFASIKSLLGSPYIVNGQFICSHNYLHSLKYIPRFIKDKDVEINNFITTYDIDINDLDSKILTHLLNKHHTTITSTTSFLSNLDKKTYDKYVKKWIDKDITILDVLFDKISLELKNNIINNNKYNYYINAKNFDLI